MLQVGSEATVSIWEGRDKFSAKNFSAREFCSPWNLSPITAITIGFRAKRSSSIVPVLWSRVDT